MGQSFTIRYLYEKLKEEIEAGNGDLEVSVAKTTFNSSLESSGLTIISVEDCGVENIDMIDDEGGMIDDVSEERFVLRGKKQ